MDKIKAIRKLLDELEAECKPKPVAHTKFTIVDELREYVPVLNDWMIRQRPRDLVMKPQQGRIGLFIASSRNYYATISFHKDLVAPIPVNLLPNELPPLARLHNTRRFGFVDLDDIVGFVQSIEPNLQSFG